MKWYEPLEFEDVQQMTLNLKHHEFNQEILLACMHREDTFKLLYNYGLYETFDFKGLNFIPSFEIIHIFKERDEFIRHLYLLSFNLENQEIMSWISNNYDVNMLLTGRVNVSGNRTSRRKHSQNIPFNLEYDEPTARLLLSYGIIPNKKFRPYIDAIDVNTILLDNHRILAPKSWFTTTFDPKKRLENAGYDVPIYYR